MKLCIVPASAGLEWVRLGLRTFWRRPLPLTALFLFITLGLSLLSHIPLVGAPVALALLPAVAQVMMLAAVAVHQGQTPSLQLGRQRLGPLLILGSLYALCFLAVLGISCLVDGGEFAHTYLGGAELTQEMAESAEFRQAAGLTLLFYIPLSIAFWHAPGLVYWLHIPPVKALFFSLVACVRNLRAFAVYALVWVAVLSGASIGISFIVALLDALGGGAAVGKTLMFLSLIVLSAMFFTSMVFTLRACFEPPQPPISENPS